MKNLTYEIWWAVQYEVLREGPQEMGWDMVWGMGWDMVWDMGWDVMRDTGWEVVRDMWRKVGREVESSNLST